LSPVPNFSLGGNSSRYLCVQFSGRAHTKITHILSPVPNPGQLPSTFLAFKNVLHVSSLIVYYTENFSLNRTIITLQNAYSSLRF